MEGIGNLIKKRITQTPNLKGALAAHILEITNETLCRFCGPMAKKYARAVYLKEKVLTIACLSGAMAQEIKLNERGIVKDINEKAQMVVLSKIRCLI